MRPVIVRIWNRWIARSHSRKVITFRLPSTSDGQQRRIGHEAWFRSSPRLEGAAACCYVAGMVFARKAVLVTDPALVGILDEPRVAGTRGRY